MNYFVTQNTALSEAFSFLPITNFISVTVGILISIGIIYLASSIYQILDTKTDYVTRIAQGQNPGSDN